MSQVTYKNEKTAKKKVFYTGTDKLYAGYNLCFDADAVRAAESNPAITAANDTAITAAGVYNERATRVEKPSSTNLGNYAGAVVGEYDNKQGPCAIEIYVPVSRGQKVSVFCDVACIIDSTRLGVQPGSYALGSTGRTVAKAMQTVDRSSGNSGLVQVLLVGLSHEGVFGDIVTANSRTTVQLPTAAIWDNFDLDLLRSNPFAGVLLEADFKRGNEYPHNTFLDAESTITQTSDAIGVLQLFVTADEEAAEIQYPGLITVSGGKKWAFEARLTYSTITTQEIAIFLGLMIPYTLDGDIFADGGAVPQAGGTLGFLKYHADTTELKATYEEAAQAINQHDDELTMVEGTYVTVGMYFDGTDIRVYYNGVDSGDPILASDIAAVDFPAAAGMLPTIACKGGAATDETFKVDWFRFAQAP